MVAVAKVSRELVCSYGVIDPAGELSADGVIPVRDLVEKPSVEDAPSNFIIAGRYVLTADAWAEIDALQPGSELEVTGIVQLEYTSVDAPRLSLMPTRLDIVLRSAADITVVRAPSWWTPERLFGAVAVVAVLPPETHV